MIVSTGRNLNNASAQDGRTYPSMPLPEKEEGEEVIISRTLPEMEIKLNR